MSSKLISITHKIDGVLTDATSVKFSDPTATYGARRQSDSTVVVADNTALNSDGTGLYSYEITGLADDIVYEYYLEIVYSGETKFINRTFTTAPTLAEGLYASETDLDDLRGTDNITVWSDLTSAGTRNRTRIQRALTWSETEIHKELGNVYTVPLVGLSAHDTQVVKYWSAILACHWLYKNRGVRDMPLGPLGQPVNLYAAETKEVRDDIWRYAIRRMRLSATARSTSAILIGRLRHRRDVIVWGGHYELVVQD